MWGVGVMEVVDTAVFPGPRKRRPAAVGHTNVVIADLPVVLIVDDQPEIRQLLRHVLARHGYPVFEADRVQRARAVLAEQPVAVLLCDIRMSGPDGLTLLRELTESGADVAVVMVTGVDDPAVAEQAVAWGAAGYLVKPFTPSQVLVTVASAARRRQAEQARRTAERHREAALQEFSTTFQAAPNGICLLGTDSRFLRVNPALCRLLDRTEAALLATDLPSLIDPDDRADVLALLSGTVAVHHAGNQLDTRFLRPDRTVIHAGLSASLVRHPDGRPSHLIAQIVDLTDRARLQHRLQHLADHDALTGLFNRRRFNEELTRELGRTRRYGTGGAVLVIDVDHFKHVNDSLGHEAGDQLITRVGELLRQRLRATDTLARFGGDEFAVILPAVDRAQAQRVADGLLDAIRAKASIPAAGGIRCATASIGIAPFSNAADISAKDLLVEADIAMYDAKDAGRDRAAVYDVEQARESRMQGRLAWIDRIRDALAGGRFVLYAQPILALNGDTVPHHELLLRMLGSRGEVISPGVFLYIAEQMGMIDQIDRWVLQQAVRCLSSQQRAGHNVRLGVNLSAVSIGAADLAGTVAAELAAGGADGHGLCFEITETAALINVERARQFATRVAQLGCEFALDDFGVGFASFFYLKHLAFAYLKIDGEFIKNLPHSHTDQLVVQAMVKIAHGLGKRTIAEFVGDADTLDLLRGYGVDYAQGFYIGRPRPLSDINLAEQPLLPHCWATPLVTTVSGFGVVAGDARATRS